MPVLIGADMGPRVRAPKTHVGQDKRGPVAAEWNRAPLAQLVTTTFGVMRDRPMVLVAVEHPGGARGFGDVWCNFPAVGAEHRARIIDGIRPQSGADAQ